MDGPAEKLNTLSIAKFAWYAILSKACLPYSARLPYNYITQFGNSQSLFPKEKRSFPKYGICNCLLLTKNCNQNTKNKKIKRKFQKGVDKQKNLCYNRQASHGMAE